MSLRPLALQVGLGEGNFCFVISGRVWRAGKIINGDFSVHGLVQHNASTRLGRKLPIFQFYFIARTPKHFPKANDERANVPLCVQFIVLFCLSFCHLLPSLLALHLMTLRQ